jgi:hypothetical protein
VTRTSAAVFGAFAMLLATRSAEAQIAVPPGRVEIGGGILWIGAQSMGTRNATETAGAGSPLTLFTAASTLDAAPAADVHVAVKATRALEADMSATYARPSLRVQISGDFESAAGVAATERLQQYTVGGGVNWYFLERRTSAVAPFVNVSLGYLRQLHENATLVDSGRYYQVGGGAKIMLSSRTGKRVKGAGIRADARAFIRSKAVALDGRSPASLALGASLFVRF